MKTCSRCFVEKPESDFYKKSAATGALYPYCKECAKAASLAHYQANKEQHHANGKKWRDANLEKAHAKEKILREKNRAVLRENYRRYVMKNPEVVKQRALKYREKNKDVLAEKSKKYDAKRKEWFRAYAARYRLKNPEYQKTYAAVNVAKLNAKSRRRFALKLGATPEWANPFFIEEAYCLAQLRTKITGIPHEVDHIVPLQSKIVCGLHCEYNLQVIPSLSNRSKSNRYWPNMPI